MYKTTIVNHDNQLANIAQANVLTESRYDFNRLEKNALYHIIMQLRKDYIETSSEQKSYSNMRVQLPEYILADIADERHIKEAREALINLRKRAITIITKETWTNVGFINWAEHDTKRKIFEIEVSSKIMPYLVDLARQYTVYSLTVAISLKSKWSQRFYELCCQYKNNLKNGIPSFHKDIDQLREMFALEDKYPKIPDFKKYVIDKAQQELQKSYETNQCDIWFEYAQEGRGDKAAFKFIIHTREITQAQQKLFKELREMSLAIYKTLLSVFPRDAKFCEKCWKHMDMHPEKIEPLYGKLERILNNYPKGADRAKVTRYMLDEDFQMSKKSLR